MQLKNNETPLAQIKEYKMNRYTIGLITVRWEN